MINENIENIVLNKTNMFVGHIGQMETLYDQRCFAMK